MNCIKMFRKFPKLKIIIATAVVLLAMNVGTIYASWGEIGVSPQIEAAVNAQQQSNSELPWLFAVFIITWAAFFAYIFYLSRKQREMKREIDALRRALQERERRDSESETRAG